jgi:predicted amidohydrolase
MTVSEAIERATFNAARVFPFLNDRGTLNVGAPADVAIQALRKGNFEFLDNYNAKSPAINGSSRARLGLPVKSSRARNEMRRRCRR